MQAPPPPQSWRCVTLASMMRSPQDYVPHLPSLRFCPTDPMICSGGRVGPRARGCQVYRVSRTRLAAAAPVATAVSAYQLPR